MHDVNSPFNSRPERLDLCLEPVIFALELLNLLFHCEDNHSIHPRRNHKGRLDLQQGKTCPKSGRILPFTRCPRETELRTSRVRLRQGLDVGDLPLLDGRVRGEDGTDDPGNVNEGVGCEDDGGDGGPERNHGEAGHRLFLAGRFGQILEGLLVPVPADPEGGVLAWGLDVGGGYEGLGGCHGVRVVCVRAFVAYLAC
jgi:hypothetical protein